METALLICEYSTVETYVPPSGGSLEIGNVQYPYCTIAGELSCSPFGGIPRNWKPDEDFYLVGNPAVSGSPFGGIPRNWKPVGDGLWLIEDRCSPFGGIPRNWKLEGLVAKVRLPCGVPPSGGSLEIGNPLTAYAAVQPPACSPFGGIPRNWKHLSTRLLNTQGPSVPPSGGSLEIGNSLLTLGRPN